MLVLMRQKIVTYSHNENEKQTILLFLECNNKMDKEYYCQSFDFINRWMRRKKCKPKNTFIILMKSKPNLNIVFCPVVSIFVVQIISNQLSNGI